MSIRNGVVVLDRTFKAAPGTVFAAWSSEAAQREWGDPGEGWSLTFDAFTFRTGETDICRFGPTGGEEYVNRNRYLDIQPNARILYATTLECRDRITFAGVVAVTFEPQGSGTTLRFTETGVYLDDADTVEGHEAGWIAMLDALGRWLDRR